MGKAVARTECVMTGEAPTRWQRMVTIFKIVWTASVILLCTTLGVLIGLENHGIGGAIGLGIAGLIIGGFLSRPDILFMFLH